MDIKIVILELRYELTYLNRAIQALERIAETDQHDNVKALYGEPVRKGRIRLKAAAKRAVPRTMGADA